MGPVPSSGRGTAAIGDRVSMSRRSSSDGEGTISRGVGVCNNAQGRSRRPNGPCRAAARPALVKQQRRAQTRTARQKGYFIQRSTARDGVAEALPRSEPRGPNVRPVGLDVTAQTGQYQLRKPLSRVGKGGTQIRWEQRPPAPTGAQRWATLCGNSLAAASRKFCSASSWRKRAATDAV